MSLKEFKETLIKDEELLHETPLISKHLEAESVLDKLYFLCRQTYLVQYNSSVIKLEEGGFGCHIEQENFDKLRSYIDDFINDLINDINQKTALFKEVLQILKKYYIETASSDENRSRTYIDESKSNSQFGLFGTYYNFNQIDWDYFEKGLETQKNQA
ncbi:hypothetical protein ACU5CE_31810 [Priestia megaterium]|uniref:hypothetical protein n=1 Tax=Priestia megaterium TaxID=1404 RepID=UPI00406BCC4A